MRIVEKNDHWDLLSASAPYRKLHKGELPSEMTRLLEPAAVPGKNGLKNRQICRSDDRPSTLGSGGADS